MWTRHGRVIWLCLTKQHSQTQEFLLGLFSHHSSETEGETWGDRHRDRVRRRKIRGDGRGNISLAWNKTQLPERHASFMSTYFFNTKEGGKKGNLWMEKRKLRSPGAKSSWSPQKCPLRGVQWSLRDLKCHDLIGCQPEIEAPDWLWHIPESNPLQLTFPLMSPYQVIHDCRRQLKCATRRRHTKSSPSGSWTVPVLQRNICTMVTKTLAAPHRPPFFL